jgi:hypothetical protein
MMMQKTMTITEALAELKTIDKRLESKRSSVQQYLYRQGSLTDPLGPDGGSRKFVTEEQQAISDLEERKVAIRRAIAKANEDTEVTVVGKTRSIAGWLTWKKEVAPGRKQYLHALMHKLRTVRQEIQSKGLQMTTTDAPGINEVTVNLSEKALTKEAEQLEEMIGCLDGQLSLKNATVTVVV